ncbi:DUF6176 family protein [Streptosporangium sandarakinum]|uniref:DUF6176 family protein n=1 Tax=Streptosporangium sandarakinum TaxID=1260955 RepID=UPI00378D56E9
MLRVSVSKVRPEQVDRLRAWFTELSGPRRGELLATFVDEGVRHETVLLVPTSDGPLMVYVMEEEDPERSIAAFRDSAHPVDADHRAVLSAAFMGVAEYEVLLDVPAEPPADLSTGPSAEPPAAQPGSRPPAGGAAPGTP